MSATATPDEKLDPGAVPVVEFTGEVKLPETGGKTLLVFRDGDGGSVGVRLEDDELQAMTRQLAAHLEDLDE